MSVFWGFLAGLIAGAIAYAIMKMEVFAFLGAFIPLIALLVFGGVWYAVYKHLEGRGKLG